MNFMIKFTKIMDTIQAKLAVPVKWLLFAFMALVCYEVTMRYVFVAPTIWGLDFRQQIYAVLIMVGCGYTLMVKGHVVVEAFTMLPPFRTRKLVAAAMWLFCYMPPMLVLVYTMFNITVLSWSVWEGTSSIWNPPAYPLKTVLTIAYANMVLQGIAELFKEIISYVKGSEDWIKAR